MEYRLRLVSVIAFVRFVARSKNEGKGKAGGGQEDRVEAFGREGCEFESSSEVVH